MSGECPRCGGAGYTWNGFQRIACRGCNPPARVLADPVRAQWVTYVPAAAWPSVRDRLVARRAG